MINVGDRVRIKGREDACCGVLKVGWTGIVAELHQATEQNYKSTILPRIVVLRDRTLCWEDDVEKL